MGIKQQIEEVYGSDIETLWLSLREDRYLVISNITLHPDRRGRGIGGKIMTMIFRYADQNGLVIAISPTSDLGTGRTALIRFYKKYGFVFNKGRFKDFEIQESMIRPLA